MGKKLNNFKHSLLMNNATYAQYFNRLTELAISMFEYKNLPDSIDPRFLELTLFSDGQAVWFKDDVLNKEYALQVMTGGNLSVYRIPNNRRAYAVNGYQKKLNENNSVIIYNNMLHTNSMLDVRMFAQRLYNLDRIIDVNANAQKTPILIQCRPEQRLTMMNLYKEYDGNSPVIFAGDNLDVNGIKVLKTDAPYVADKIYQLKTQVWNEALTYFGISNINVQKKERLITDEVTRNQGGTIASRYSRLESRRQAFDKINKMFDHNIEVDYREDFQIVERENVIGEDKEGGGDNE